MSNKWTREGLDILKDLFNGLENYNIPYCHFKSNEHLEEAMHGETDIDLLVSKDYVNSCEKLLRSLGYKRFLSQPWSVYPGIEDWIGFDKVSGRLVHIHLHYQLLSGLKYVKEQHLPWESAILNTAVRDPKFNILIINPHLEMILLVVRISIKTSNWRLLKGILKGKVLPENIQDELKYLHQRIDLNLIRHYTTLLFGKKDGDKVFGWIERKMIDRISVIRSMRKIVKQQYKENQRITGLELLSLRFVRLCKAISVRVKKKLHLDYRRGKRPHSGGVIIAIIGCDGSGKSTVSNDLFEWLSWKVDIQKLYLGSGDGRVSLSVKMFRFMIKFIQKLRKGNSSKEPTGFRESKHAQSGIKTMVRAFFAVVVSHDRYRKVKQAKKRCLNGKVIITDRYPQKEFFGINDGPHLKNDGFWIEKLASLVENKKYNRMKALPPDVVIKLKVPIEVAIERKPVENQNVLRKKVNVIEKLRYEGARVFDVDATRPLNEVKLEVKEIVWDSL